MKKRGNSADDRLPKFFKVYLPDESGDDLELPISFNSFLPKSLPENVIVRSIYENVWKMAFRKCCGDIEKFAMVNGWKRIIKDEDLKGGEFLEFEFDGSRFFNFCIYGVNTEVQCNPERSKMNLMVNSDQDDVDDDGEDKSSKDIIVIDDDDDDDQDYGDDDYADDENERRRRVKTERKEKGSFGVSKKRNNEDDRQYLDNDMNPFFIVNHNLQRKTDLRVPAKVIKHYDLQFPKFIYLIDPLDKISGILKRKVEGHTIKGFESIIRRNKVRSTDKLICELEMEMNGLVRKIKVHVIRW